MTVGDIMFALTIALTVGMIAWSWVMASFMDKTSKALKDIQDNQFDAEEVMKLYNMKFNRPIVYEDKKQIRELYETIELTWEQYHMIKDNDDFDAYIKRELADLYAERIMPFVDIVVDSNYARNTEVIKARLRVVEKGTKTD